MRFAVVILLAVGVCALAGCQGAGFKGDGAATGLHAAEPWPFMPVKMRVHPFTSLVHDPATDSTVLEARIELLDQVGDTTKGVGDFRFELYKTQQLASREGEDQRLMQWNASMQTLADNRRYYDPITRTYLFKLNIDRPIREHQRVKLWVQFTPSRGPRLTAEMTLMYEPASAASPGATGHPLSLTH